MSKATLPLFNQRIMHDALSTTAQTLEEILAEKDPEAGCIIPLLGPTRVGKSAVVKRLVEKSGDACSLFPMKDIVCATLPPQVSGREIYASGLIGMGFRTRDADKTKVLRDRLYRAIRERDIKVIAFDEVNHLIERGANLSPRAAADHLKAIVDETGVSLILSGLPRFQQIIDGNEQLRDRANGTVLLKPYDWQNDEDRDAFTGAVDAAIGSLEKSGFIVTQDFEDIVRRIYGATGGRVPMMLRLFKSCAVSERVSRKLSLASFARAASKMQQSGIPVSAFFNDNEPDEVELHRSFASVMSEAGLDFPIQSLAGLEASWAESALI
jgi:hypothetical protein